LPKILEQIKNNPSFGRRKKSQFSIKVVNKTAASATQFAKYTLLHAYCLFTYNCCSQLHEHKQKLHIASSWYHSIFGSKLRTD